MDSMEKRSCTRIPVRLDITCSLWNPLFWKKRFSGTIENISERGLYIKTQTEDFPLDSLLEVFMAGGITISARSSTIVRKECVSDTACTGMGISLTDPPEDYLQYIHDLRASQA
jgi:hypothetical protein